MRETTAHTPRKMLQHIERTYRKGNLTWGLFTRNINRVRESHRQSFNTVSVVTVSLTDKMGSRCVRQRHCHHRHNTKLWQCTRTVTLRVTRPSTVQCRIYMRLGWLLCSVSYVCGWHDNYKFFTNISVYQGLWRHSQSVYQGLWCREHDYIAFDEY